MLQTAHAISLYGFRMLLVLAAFGFTPLTFAEEDPPPCSPGNECEEIVVTEEKPSFPSQASWCGGDSCSGSPPGFEPLAPQEAEAEEECGIPPVTPAGPGAIVLNPCHDPSLDQIQEDFMEAMCSAAAETAKSAAAAGGCSSLCERKFPGKKKAKRAQRAACIVSCTAAVETLVLCDE